MKVVLFCAGLGTRIRDYSEDIPKPMIPIANKPILCHLMEYYRQYGHDKFVLCLDYKAEVIRDYFLKDQKKNVLFGEGVDVVRTSGQGEIAFVDTGPFCNIGQRLRAVRDLVAGEEMFMANYSDGLTNVNLDEVIARFKDSGKIACFLAVRPPLTYHVADIAGDGHVKAILPARQSEIWINGGYFIFRPEVFDYMHEGEELVVEPFQRLIEDDQLLAFKHDGFWQSMDTLRDRQMLEELVAHGSVPWRGGGHSKIKRNILAAV